MATFEFITPGDKPTLLAINSPFILAELKKALHELAYKIHAVADPGEFQTRFTQIQYQVVIIDEMFCAVTAEENQALQFVQTLPMVTRRHATVILIGNSFVTLDRMQAFRQSVHAVANPADMSSIRQIIQQAVTDNELFLNVYRETQRRIAQGA